jgi:gamma-butyrobetaine dioxygenase
LARDPLPAGDHAAVIRDNTALLDWLRHVERLGFALLHGVPPTPGAVCDVVGLFGYVRETNYGRLFDVVSVEEPMNLAFTAMALGNHTDNPYRDPVPQLQLLHCLEAAGEGGESIVVDGFAVAERLRREAPAEFDLLTKTKVPFRYLEPGSVDLRHEAPLVELDAGGDLRTVRYNSRSTGPIDLDPDDVPAFYAAHRRFGRLLHDPAMTVGFKLRPGDLFIVDNRRVLHGRRGFGGGRRHLQGARAPTRPCASPRCFMTSDISSRSATTGSATTSTTAPAATGSRRASPRRSASPSGCTSPPSVTSARRSRGISRSSPRHPGIHSPSRAAR